MNETMRRMTATLHLLEGCDKVHSGPAFETVTVIRSALELMSRMREEERRNGRMRLL